MKHPVGWVLLVAALLITGHFIWYDDTPFGVAPTLDGRENLQLARTLASGSRVAEPFYRAPLYPALLAGLLRAGLPEALLPWAARLLNAIALLVAAACAGKIAERLWGCRSAAALATALVGLNPVLLFFAADPYDILLATAFFSAALYVAINWKQAGADKLMPVLVVSLLLGIGALARSHLLLIALAWPVLAGSYANAARAKTVLAATVGVVGALAGLGLANLALAGEFRVTPWQGAYNLWSANGPHANGRFFTQTRRLRSEEAFDNPAKAESIRLFEVETGAKPPLSISAMNRYWLHKTARHLADHPVRWITLMLRKCFSLVHNHEQYDNKTYAFEKSLAPWLSWNPLGWGILLALAIAGAVALRPRPSVLFWFVLIYAAGVVLFHTNNRFRVPLFPALAVLAGGVVVHWRDRSKLAVIAGVAILIFPLWFNVAGADTTIQDYVLLADAAQHAGRELEARQWAERGLRLQPDRDDLREVILLADFNLLATGQTAPLTPTETEARLARCAKLTAPSQQLRYVAGVYLWELGRREEALSTWSTLVPHQSALAALLHCDHPNLAARTAAEAIPIKSREVILHLALAEVNDRPSREWLNQNLSAGEIEQLRASIYALLPPQR